MSRTVVVAGFAISRTPRAALTYVALVFGTGFLLGAIRVTLLVPRLGMRTAELIEMPFMFVAIVLAARFVNRRFALSTAGVRLGTGLVALGLLLGAEVLLAVVLQDRSLGAYIASRDPVSGTVYLAMLAVFALMPWVLSNPQRERRAA
jgi:hypothetical protein